MLELYCLMCLGTICACLLGCKLDNSRSNSYCAQKAATMQDSLAQLSGYSFQLFGRRMVHQNYYDPDSLIYMIHINTCKRNNEQPQIIEDSVTNIGILKIYPKIKTYRVEFKPNKGSDSVEINNNVELQKDVRIKSELFFKLSRNWQLFAVWSRQAHNNECERFIFPYMSVMIKHKCAFAQISSKEWTRFHAQNGFRVNDSLAVIPYKNEITFVEYMQSRLQD